ncbi:NADPH-dependent FMN reductase [Altererythrobacter sp. C41]|uniref:NADPH-dependent FMN reductase n=1 Tax=Altererythrobacter sp. C41 TaxID=2806021 RepID=UPI0019342C60|nr:NADPH-dependent FMN reductase [Altererythrobacter sp. C41]MBM0168790.1 NAD(P)H-dependent oxidoreductase [Altererythrobacter sp. C41]
MVQILGLSGSLREGSFNSALLRAAADLMPEGATLEIGTIEGIPLYHGDLEAEHGLPEPVVVLKEQIARADGLLLATPEYNNGIPGVFKNAIDWTTRPASDIERVFGGKKAALMGASPGAFGTILSQNAWLPVLRTLGVNLWSSGRMLVPRASTAFDDAGKLTDPKSRERLGAFLEGFVAYARG